MKICFINPTFLVRRPITDLIDQLGDEHEVAIFLPKKPFKKLEFNWHNDKALKKAKIYSYSAVNIPFLPFEWPIPITPMFFINLYKIFKEYKIVHMWTYFYINSFFTVFYKLFNRKTKLIMTADTFPGYSFNPGKGTSFCFKLYTKMFGWFLFSVPTKIQIYGKSLLLAGKKNGIKRSKIVIIPTGIHVEKFSNAEMIDRKEIKCQKNDIIIMYAGLVVPRKGINLMLEVMKKLQKDHQNIKLLIIGEGPTKKYYIQKAKDMGLDGTVIFLPWRKDIPSLLKTSDILILPSQGEGLPGIVMEAMASGIPVVASDIPCIPDLISNNNTGYLCQMNNTNQFYTKITFLIEHPDIRKNMGKKGNEKIKDFSWSKIKREYIEVYKCAE